MMKQKILIFVNEFQNIINFRLSLINYLSNRGLNIEVICYSKKNIQENQIKDLLDIPVHYLSGDSKGTSLIDELKNIFRLYLLIRSISPNLILSYTIKPNLYSSLVTRILQINNIKTITGMGSTYIEGGMIKQLIFILFKLFNNKRVKYIFQNNQDLNIFKKKGIIYKHNSFLIPGSGVDLNKYNKNLNYIYQNDQATFNFLFIGRMIKHKGIEELYNAALKLLSSSKLKIKFTIVGKFDKDDKYAIDQNLYNKMSNNNSFSLIGFSNNVIEFILKSNCILLTSKREGMPMSLLEASAIGRPMISSDVPGCKEIVIDNFNGFKYKSGDSEDLYNKMLMIVNLPREKILNFCENAHNHVAKNFSSKIINDKYYEAIRKNL